MGGEAQYSMLAKPRSGATPSHIPGRRSTLGSISGPALPSFWPDPGQHQQGMGRVRRDGVGPPPPDVGQRWPDFGQI